MTLLVILSFFAGTPKGRGRLEEAQSFPFHLQRCSSCLHCCTFLCIFAEYLYVCLSFEYFFMCIFTCICFCICMYICICVLRLFVYMYLYVYVSVYLYVYSCLLQAAFFWNPINKSNHNKKTMNWVLLLSLFCSMFTIPV